MTLLSIARPRMMSYPQRGYQHANATNGYLANKNSKEDLPPVNIIEEANQYLIQLAAPGFSKEDINLTVDRDTLTIEAETKESQNDASYLTCEFDVKGFSRKFTLGKSVDTAKIEASYTNGVLTVRLAKREEAIEKPARSISVS